MPYIITTKSVIGDPTRRTAPIYGYRTDSRTAVATLEEARQTALNAVVGDRDYEDIRHVDVHAAHILDEEGGIVGPLPDGTVIEVRHVDWIAMRALAGRLPVRTHDKPAVLAAFNAR